MTRPALKVGDSIWLRLKDVRIYIPGKSSNIATGKDFWVERKIIEVTPHSYIVSTGYTSQKWSRRKAGTDYLTSKEEVELKIWMHDHAHKVKMALDRSHDPAVLLAVAELIGYTPAKPLTLEEHHATDRS